MKFSIFNFQFSKILVYILIFIFIILGAVQIASAADPVGNDWFQLLTDHQTGADNTGDGGTGNPADLNYYYVGQSFNTNIQIKSATGSSAANIWIDYDQTKLTASGLSTGTFFSNWSSQTISGGRIKSTGYRTSGYSTGTGAFGNVSFRAIAPTMANYGTFLSTVLDINIGTVGASTESNISRDGSDILDDAKDFQLHIWADTKKPYAKSPVPVNAAANVSIDSGYAFELRDSKAGEGNDSGVGTGVNTANGLVTFNDGAGAVNYNSSTNFSCSGTWGTNLCNATVNPNSPSGISGDQRNWKYNTAYTVSISSFRDLASADQSQLGDSNGPNIMDTKVWSFTTEPDSISPRSFNEAPSRGSSGDSVSADISFEIQDKKIYPSSISGVGIDPATCRLNVSSLTFPLTTFQQGDSSVSVQTIDYGYRFTINPNSSFGQNEMISVSIYDCADLVGNIMATDNYTFSTADSNAPYISDINPANDASISNNSNIRFNIKDDGVGVDLDKTVVFINGVYYTKDGGAGVVTSSGTRIAFADSLSFMGGNYSGDTTAIGGVGSNYSFLIDPENNFDNGESVPVIIYTQDLSGNVMDRYVYALAVGGGSPVSGESYCGSGTSWNGSACIASTVCVGENYCGSGTSWNGTVCTGTGGGPCNGNTFCGNNTTWNGLFCVGNASGPSYSPLPSSYCGSNTIWDNNTSVCVGSFFGSDYCGEGTVWNGSKCVNDSNNQPAVIYNPSVIQVDEKSVLVTWYTTVKGSSKVVHDITSHGALNSGYYYSSVEKNENVFYHSVLIEGLSSGTLYYFKPVSKINGQYSYGEELKMAPRFVSEVKEIKTEVIKEVIVEKEVASVCQPVEGAIPVTPVTPVTGGETSITTPETPFQIGNISMEGGNIVIKGYAKPFSKIKITIYQDE